MTVAVWRGCYENRYLVGYYDSAERAMGVLHEDGWKWTRTLWHFDSPSPNRGRGFQEWSNDQDWDDAIDIYPATLDVVREGPLRSADHVRRVDDHPSGRSLVSKELTEVEADLVAAGATPRDDEG